MDPMIQDLIDRERDDSAENYWKQLTATRDALDASEARERKFREAKYAAEQAAADARNAERIADQERHINRTSADIAEAFAKFIDHHDSQRLPNGSILSQPQRPSEEQRWIVRAQAIIDQLEQRVALLEAQVSSR